MSTLEEAYKMGLQAGIKYCINRVEYMQIEMEKLIGEDSEEVGVCDDILDGLSKLWEQWDE